MKKLFKIKQTPYTPLILLMIIAAGYVFGARHQTKNADVPVDTGSAEVVADESKRSDSESVDQDNPIENISNGKTAAQMALEDGQNIKESVADDEVMKIIENYCNRKVVSCSSQNMQRTEGEDWYQQSFDSMSGYMNLVKLYAAQSTTLHIKVSTKLKNVTAVLVYPDDSYVILELNKEIQCRLPQGDSMIIYIGNEKDGSVKAEIKANEDIISKRM